MEYVKILTLAELLQATRPLTVTASLRFPCTISHASSLSKPTAPPPPSPSMPPPRHRPGLRVLTAVKRPAVLVGTLTLPTYNAPSSSSPCSCFRFSDGFSTVCCDLLRFDASAIGKEIRVSAWNFIPSKPCGGGGHGGFLEIIKWDFTDSNEGHLRKIFENLNYVDSFPLVLNHRGNDSSRARYRVYGVVESVGPVSVVPCTMAASGSDLSSGSSMNLPGFLVQVMRCECRLCGSQAFINGLMIGSMADGNSHYFTKKEIVYFCGNASSWHPAITKLIGNRVMLSGLKKKLVFIGKEESRVMYVTVDMSVLLVCRFLKKCLPCLKSDIKGKGECGAYTGVIKGVYMQGMAVELDNDVWLLLTDQLHTLTHGLRVGAIVSVRNVHFVDPKFSWTKIIILGACIKTNIIVESFSPLETLCNVALQSLSMLGKFIQSLPFSARLWVLLLVSSLCKKFAGILSDKEILGSNDKEGLAQMFASSQLPPSVFQTQHGAFMGLCRHDIYGCGRELHCGVLRLVIPMSIFICHCIATLTRMLKSENHCKLLLDGNHCRFLSCEERYHGRSARRIIPSKAVGIVLLGYFKIDPSSGRIQLVDATGGIDVLIPDLPFTWNPNKIYEVMEYDIVVDGFGEHVDHLELLETESLSCRRIFNCTQAARELSTSIYVYLLWKNAKCRNYPLNPCINRKNESEVLEPGCYHLLRVSHKFPLLEKYSNNMRSKKSSTFVEAILLPWILLLAGKIGILHSSNISMDKTKELSEYCISLNNEVSNKRQKLVKESISSSKDQFCTFFYELNACSNSSSKSKENKKCINLSSSHDISCLVTVGSIQNGNVVSPAILHPTSAVVDTGFNSKPTARKILLEFSSDRFLKYQLLQIGGYYIIEHHRKDCFCTKKDPDFGGSAKFGFDSGKHIWSLSFVSDEVLLDYKSEYTSVEDSLCPSIGGAFRKDQIEQLLLRSKVDSSGVCSDVCLYLPANLTSILEDNIKESEDGQSKQFAKLKESANISLSIGTVEARPTLCSRFLSSNCLFPEGNLISLEGNVVDIHDVGSSFSNSCLSSASLDALRLKGLVGVTRSFCINVLVHRHIVKIFGSISKHAFPTGFGPGVHATFHRILDVRDQNKFMLLPVSFIVIQSTIIYDKQYNDSSSNLRPRTDAYNASPDYFSCLISELHQCLSHKQIVLRCRVVAVFILVLERNTTNFDAETNNNAKETLFDIPLSCFVLDDGSSYCCCWANAERAATLLRLHEGLPERAIESSDRSLKFVDVNDNSSKTTRSTTYHLRKILKNYKRITVKNYASIIDSPYQDLAVSVTSDNAFCSSDENLLKFLIFNACFGTVWSVVASVMDAEEVGHLQKKYLTEMENMHTMPNIWAIEVSYMDTLAEARNMIKEVLKS